MNLFALDRYVWAAVTLQPGRSAPQIAAGQGVYSAAEIAAACDRLARRGYITGMTVFWPVVPFVVVRRTTYACEG